MAIDNSQSVDGLGFDAATGETVLIISDHLDWFDLEHHAEVLSQKLTGYLHFISGGQLAQSFPKAEGRPVKISLVHRYEPDERARQMLANFKARLAESDIAFTHGSLPPEY